TMGLNFTVDEAHEQFVIRSSHVIIGISLPANLLTVYLLWRKTPNSIGHYKYLLIMLQSCSALIDLHLGVFFMPVPLFPLIGCYCKGMLCEAHVPPHISVVIFFFLVLGCLVTLFFCIFYRHQVILPAHHKLKLRKNRYKIILFSLYAITWETMSLLILISDNVSNGKSDYLEKEQPAMIWLTSKDSWVVYDTDSSIRFVVYYVLIVSFSLEQMLSSRIVFRHTTRYFEVADMSSRTLAFHRAMMKSLMMQALCWLLVVAPVAVLSASVLLESIPHEMISVAFLVAQLFSVVHAQTVIANSPTLRQSVLSYFGFICTTGSTKMKALKM
ncbi:hypothetical protein PENTCL1PPCAC_14547, partial [Pristionchus entomophagus]